MSIYKSSSLAMIPTAYKDGKLYSVRPVEHLGSELVTNGDFSSASDWTFSGGGVAISGGKLNFTGTTREATQSISVVNTKTYRVSYEVSNFSAGSVRAEIGSSVGTSRTANGIYSEYIVASGANTIEIDAVSVFTGSIDNVSVKEVIAENGDFTFTRGSNLSATRVNASQLIEKGRENVVLESNSFSASAWSKGNITLTSGQSGYDGSNDAWLLESNATTSTANLVQGISNPYLYTSSIYAKAGTSNWIRISATGSNSVYYDLGNGVVGSTIGANFVDKSIESVGNGWYRCSVTFNGRDNFYVFIANGDLDSVTNSGDNILIQDAQLEQGLVATSVIETGASTAQAGILENTPRFDYSGGATCPSLLLEPSRTNLLPYSEYFETWSNVNLGTANLATITTNYATSPDGTNNATRIQFDLNGGTTLSDRVIIRQLISTATGRYFSVWMKSATGTDQKVLWHYGGDENEQTITNEWQRFEYDRTSVNLSYVGLSLRGGESSVDTADILVWGFQVESGSYPTSYIPCMGTSQTRSQDLSVTASPSTSYFGQTEGTIFTEIKINAITSGSYSRVFNLKNSGGSNQIYFQQNDSRINGVVFNGSNQFTQSTSSGFLSVGSTYKMAMAYKDGDYALYINGTQINTSSASGLGTLAVDRVDFTTLSGNINLGNEVKQSLVFNTRLSNTELASLTTL